MPDLSEAIESLQSSLDVVPAALAAIVFLAGPTVAWIIYRVVVLPRTSRYTEQGGGLLWMCIQCKSANEVRDNRCYRCGLARTAISGDLHIVDGDEIVALSPDAQPAPARRGSAPVPVMAAEAMSAPQAEPLDPGRAFGRVGRDGADHAHGTGRIPTEDRGRRTRPSSRRGRPAAGPRGSGQGRGVGWDDRGDDPEGRCDGWEGVEPQDVDDRLGSTATSGGDRRWRLRRSVCRATTGRGPGDRAHRGGSTELPPVPADALPGRHGRSLAGRDRAAAAVDPAQAAQHHGDPGRGGRDRPGGAARSCSPTEGRSPTTRSSWRPARATRTSATTPGPRSRPGSRPSRMRPRSGDASSSRSRPRNGKPIRTVAGRG